MNFRPDFSLPRRDPLQDSTLDLSTLVSEMDSEMGSEMPSVTCSDRSERSDPWLEPERAALSRPQVLQALGIARRWGDPSLLADLGVPGAWPENTGELWLASDLPGFASPLKGDRRRRTLRELIRLDSRAILGFESESFPLLIKLLLGGGRMSVQVHPDGPSARALGRGPRGKHEAWWVLSARPSALIVRGLHESCSEDLVRAEVAQGRFQERLNRFQPRPGQLYDIPPGTIHGCGDGLAILEVQETSDITFRLYDWGRPGTPLHLEEALQVSRLSAEPNFQPLSAYAGLGAESQAPFQMQAHRLPAGVGMELGQSAGVELIVPTRGRVLVESWGLELAPFEVLLWPASCPKGRLQALDEVELLWTAPRPEAHERAFSSGSSALP